MMDNVKAQTYTISQSAMPLQVQEFRLDPSSTWMIGSEMCCTLNAAAMLSSPGPNGSS